jgi:hypothetical protein
MYSHLLQLVWGRELLTSKTPKEPHFSRTPQTSWKPLIQTWNSVWQSSCVRTFSGNHFSRCFKETFVRRFGHLPWPSFLRFEPRRQTAATVKIFATWHFYRVVVFTVLLPRIRFDIIDLFWALYRTYVHIQQDKIFLFD